MTWYSFDIGANLGPAQTRRLKTMAGYMPLGIEYIRTYPAYVKALGGGKNTYPGFSVLCSANKFKSFHRGSFATPLPEKKKDNKIKCEGEVTQMV
jgi:hypothetical protein